MEPLKRELNEVRARQAREEELQRQQELEQGIKREAEEAMKKAAEEKRRAMEDAREAEREAREAKDAEGKAREQRLLLEKDAVERGRREVLAQIEADKRAEAERVKRQVEETNRAVQEQNREREAQEEVMKNMIQQVSDGVLAIFTDTSWARYDRSHRDSDQPNHSTTSESLLNQFDNR